MSVCHLHVFYTVYTIVASWSVCPWLSKALGKLQWTAPEAALRCPKIWIFLVFGISWAGFQLEPTASFHRGKTWCNSGFKHIAHWKLSVSFLEGLVWRVWRFADANKVASNCLLKAIPSAARPNKSRSSSKHLRNLSRNSTWEIPGEFDLLHFASCFWTIRVQKALLAHVLPPAVFVYMERHHDLALKMLHCLNFSRLKSSRSVLHWQNLHSWLCWPRGAKSIKSARNLRNLVV